MKLLLYPKNQLQHIDITKIIISLLEHKVFNLHEIDTVLQKLFETNNIDSVELNYLIYYLQKYNADEWIKKCLDLLSQYKETNILVNNLFYILNSNIDLHSYKYFILDCLYDKRDEYLIKICQYKFDINYQYIQSYFSLKDLKIN